MNWHDAGSPVGAQGVRVNLTFLSGYVWCENVGWISLGDGSPANGATYANATRLDYGVNIAANGALSGLGWGENIGWVNMDSATNFVGLRCPADFDNDEFVTGEDFDAYLAAFEAGC